MNGTDAGINVSVLRIPVTPRPQTFSIMLSGTLYTIRLYWLKPAECWVFDFYDRTGENKILCGVPLVTGSDLLGQFAYVGIGGGLFVVTDTLPPDTIPSWTELGVTGHVYYVPRRPRV